MEKVNGVPNHIGIIMDGNGRWAEKRGKKRSYGHKVGSELVDKIATHAYSRGVKTVSLYAFSTENWARPKEEVDELMRLLKTYFSKFISKVVKKKVRISVMGDISVLKEDLKKVIIDATEKTKDFTERTLNIGLNYGGRQEIVMAVKELIKDGKEITVDGISSKLYSAPFGEPDLIIRTGGEYRLSNFMLYQGGYSELYFTDVLWPDFNEEELDKALEEYSTRHRRFGKVK